MELIGSRDGHRHNPSRPHNQNRSNIRTIIGHCILVKFSDSILAGSDQRLGVSFALTKFEAAIGGGVLERLDLAGWPDHLDFLDPFGLAETEVEA